MKKFLSLFIAVLISLSTFAFVGCGKSKSTFSDVVFSDKTVEYDGTEKKSVMKVTGVPVDTTVTYTFELDGQEVDSAINVGIYEVTAVITKEGYVTTEKQATLTITSSQTGGEDNKPDLTYSETSTEVYLFDIGGTDTVDFKLMTSTKTQEEIVKYKSVEWNFSSIGSVSNKSYKYLSSEVSYSDIRKEQFSVTLYVTTESGQKRTLFRGKVDFFDYENDGMVWNNIDSNITDYTVTTGTASSNGVVFEENCTQGDLIDNGICLRIKDKIFDYTDDEIQDEIDKLAAFIDNGEPEYDKPKLRGITYLSCKVMIRPLHSKEYYTRFNTNNASMNLTIALYDDTGVTGVSRNRNEYSAAGHNIPKALNEWDTLTVTIADLMKNYDAYISSTKASIGTTGLVGLQHNQVYVGIHDVSKIAVYKVGFLISDIYIAD